MEYQWEDDEVAMEITNVLGRLAPRDKSLYGNDDGDLVSTFHTDGASIQERLEEAATTIFISGQLKQILASECGMNGDMP